VDFIESEENLALPPATPRFKELRMQDTVSVHEDGRVLVSAIKDGYNAYLTYTEQLLKLHNENMARLLSDAVAINPWWSPRANERLGEWADLYVSSVESTMEWVRRMQQSPPTAPLARVAARAVQGNHPVRHSTDGEGHTTEEARADAHGQPADVRDEPANDERLMQQGEQRVEEARDEANAADHERREEAGQQAHTGGRRGARAGGERQR
jgi:hypothetical protein